MQRAKDSLRLVRSTGHANNVFQSFDIFPEQTDCSVVYFSQNSFPINIEISSRNVSDSSLGQQCPKISVTEKSRLDNGSSDFRFSDTNHQAGSFAGHIQSEGKNRISKPGIAALLRTPGFRAPQG